MTNTITTVTDDTPEVNNDRNNNMLTTKITSEDIKSTQDEFFTDTIVSHKVNHSRQQKLAKTVEVLYRVRWNEFISSNDTWEPLSNLTRSHMIHYHHRNKLEITTLLDQRNDDRTTLAQEEAIQATTEGSYVIHSIINHDHQAINKQCRQMVRWFDHNNSDDSW